jgi:hypothetical protein
MPVPKRTAKFLSAIFVGILAGTALTTTSHSETAAADNCLSGPKGETPPGSHWYYRIDRSTKRQCWYLREEGDNLSQAAPRSTSPSAKPLPPQTDTAPQNSVANARAELPARTNRNDGSSTAFPANAAGLDAPRANAPDPRATSTVVVSRWPEPSGMSPAPSPQPATSNLAANGPANSTVAPAPAAAAVTFVARDSTKQGLPGSIPQLFVAVAGALTLGSITASMIFKFGRTRHPRPGTIRGRRGPIREQTDDDRIVLSNYPDADVLPRRPRFGRDIGDASNSEDRMAEFLSRISGRSPT